MCVFVCGFFMWHCERRDPCLDSRLTRPHSCVCTYVVVVLCAFVFYSGDEGINSVLLLVCMRVWGQSLSRAGYMLCWFMTMLFVIACLSAMCWVCIISYISSPFGYGDDEQRRGYLAVI